VYTRAAAGAPGLTGTTLTNGVTGLVFSTTGPIAVIRPVAPGGSG